mgnify:CR=1 FL=1
MFARKAVVQRGGPAVIIARERAGQGSQYDKKSCHR